jgi:exodeoxyribonuclease-3
MKITTWNVNGLRALLGKGAWNWIDSYRPEILCLQEIKAQPEQLTEEQHRTLGESEILWNPADRKGYSGVLTLLNEPCEPVDFRFGEDGLDNEGRIIQVRHPGFTLFNIYFPNGGRGLERLSYKLGFYERFLEAVDRLQAAGEKVIICGDFNTAHREIDLRNPKQNQTTSGFLPEERVWIDRYLSHGLKDAFREIYPEREQYTWWTYRLNARARNIGWRLDYFLVSESLMPVVHDVVIHQEVMGSDHCPVTLILDV